MQMKVQNELLHLKSIGLMKDPVVCDHLTSALCDGSPPHDIYVDKGDKDISSLRSWTGWVSDGMQKLACP